MCRDCKPANPCEPAPAPACWEDDQPDYELALIVVTFVGLGLVAISWAVGLIRRAIHI